MTPFIQIPDMIVKRLIAHHGIEFAGYMALMILISIFPFFIFLYALAGFLGPVGLMQDLLTNHSFEIPLKVRETLVKTLSDLATSESRPGLLTFGIIGSLWTASSGVEVLRDGLNRAYELKEYRSFIRRRRLSVILVIGAAFCGLLAASLIILGPLVIEWLRETAHVPGMLLFSGAAFGYLFGFSLLCGLFYFLYRFLPAHQHPKPACFPGAFLGALLWVISGSVFSLYLVYFDNYDRVYGGLGGMILTLIFLQASALIVLLGAEVNGVLMKRRSRLRR